jgi:aspartate kinase
MWQGSAFAVPLPNYTTLSSSFHNRLSWVDVIMVLLDSVSQAHSNWVVQKFGGTSVGKFALNIIEQVVQYDHSIHDYTRTLLTEIPHYRPSLVDNRVAVVCSARSSSTKAEGTTNR